MMNPASKIVLMCDALGWSYDASTDLVLTIQKKIGSMEELLQARKEYNEIFNQVSIRQSGDPRDRGPIWGNDDPEFDDPDDVPGNITMSVKCKDYETIREIRRISEFSVI